MPRIHEFLFVTVLQVCSTASAQVAPGTSPMGVVDPILNRATPMSFAWRHDGDYVIQLESTMFKKGGCERVRKALEGLRGTKSVKLQAYGCVSVDVAKDSPATAHQIKAAVEGALERVESTYPDPEMARAYVVVEPRVPSPRLVSRALQEVRKLTPQNLLELRDESERERAGDIGRLRVFQELGRLSRQLTTANASRDLAFDPELGELLRCLKSHFELLDERGFGVMAQGESGSKARPFPRGSPMAPGYGGWGRLSGQWFTHPRTQRGRAYRWLDLRLIDHYDRKIREVLERVRRVSGRKLAGNPRRVIARYRALEKTLDPVSKRLEAFLLKFCQRGAVLPEVRDEKLPRGARQRK